MTMVSLDPSFKLNLPKKVKNYNADSKYLSANHFLTLDFFDMWLCFDVGPFKTMQFGKVKCLNHDFTKTIFCIFNDDSLLL